MKSARVGADSSSANARQNAMDSTARLASSRARAASPAVECAPTVVRARSARNLAARNFFSKAMRSPGSELSARSSARIRVSVSEIASNGDGVDDVDGECAHKDDCDGDDDADDDEQSSPTSRPARATMAFKRLRVASSTRSSPLGAFAWRARASNCVD